MKIKFKQRQHELAGKKPYMIGACVLAIVAIALYVIVGQKERQPRLPAEPIKPLVQVQQLEPAPLIRRINLTGKTVPVAAVDVAAKYNGRITEVLVDLGDTVTAGQVLLRQDARDVMAALAEQRAVLMGANADAVQSQAAFKANYQKAQADYQHAQINFERYQQLHAQGAVSRQALDNVEQELTAAQAELLIWEQQLLPAGAASVVSKQAARAKAQAAVVALEQQQHDLVLRAPHAGVIGFRQAEVGAFAQAGQKLLAVIDQSQVYVDCQATEQDVGRLALDTLATVQVEAVGKSYTGKIIYISPTVQSETQSFVVRLLLSDADPQLRLGLFARTTLEVMLRPATLAVPKAAVVTVNGQARVYVIQDGVAMERLVKTGFQTDDRIEIIEGVTAEELVAINNLARLKSGMAITVATQPE